MCVARCPHLGLYRRLGPSEKAPRTDIELTTNERSRVVDRGRGMGRQSRRCPVCVARCPHCPAQLCRLPRARPNLTKPVTALLPYVPICGKQIWMENSWGDARKVENTGFTCDAMPESWKDFGFLMFGNPLNFHNWTPSNMSTYQVFVNRPPSFFAEEFDKLAPGNPPLSRVRGYPGSPFYFSFLIPWRKKAAE